MDASHSESDAYVSEFRQDFYSSSHILRKHQVLVEYRPDPPPKRQRLRRNPEDWVEGEDNLDIPDDGFRKVAGPDGVQWREIRLVETSLPKKNKSGSATTQPLPSGSATTQLPSAAAPSGKKTKKRIRGKESEKKRQKEKRAPAPGVTPLRPRIHTEPHADPKNVVGVCVIFVYLIPGFKFNHKVRSWFVIWDAGVIIELPPWVAFFYPSSLFIHFNCDISDIEIIHTVDGSRPTHGSSRKSRQGGFVGPALPSDAHGRGSIVFFSQGNLFSSAETDYPTLNAARRAGLPGTTDIPGNFDKYYAPYGTFVPA